MTIEVMGPQVGSLNARDVRAVAHDARPGGRIAVLVLGRDGDPPFVGEVTLTVKRSGHSEHLALLCPSCEKPRVVLYSRRAELACAGCARRRTRRQAERTLAAWKRGGREEDRLLRLIGRGRPLTELRELVDEIVAGDADRMAVVLDDYNHVVVVTEVANGRS